MATVACPPEFDLRSIAISAGSLDPDAVRYEGGHLVVLDVDQLALDQAVSSYDHDAHLSTQVEDSLVAALNNHLDSVAGQRRYDSRFTCALRAGFAGPFQAEGQAFAAWMDQCNMVGYSLMQEVKAGLAPGPTEAELIALMPAIEWPPSPIPEGAV